jgi:hypothetical protein
MNTPSATIVNAAQEALTATDVQGRRLTLRRLDALGKLKLFKALGPALAQNEPYLGMALLAASVAKIDDVPCPSLVSEALIESMVQRLGDVGLAAVAQALRSDETLDSDMAKN